MFKATADAVRSICATDPSITAEQVKCAVKVLSGESVEEITNTPLDRSFNRAQVAAALGVKPRAVTNLAKRGMLKPVRTTSRRVTRYTGASVRALLGGAK